MLPQVSPTALGTLCRHHHVTRLEVFGSYARNEENSDSDVDLLVEFEPKAPIGFIELSKLSYELNTLFGRAVDLVPRNGLNKLIRNEILSQAKVIFAA